VLTLLCVSALASARQMATTTYDATRPAVRIEGVVTQIDWVNPNAFLRLNVRDAAGAVRNWAVEIGNPIELEHGGWKADAVHIGDTVAVMGTPARGDPRRMFAQSVTLNGKRLFEPPKAETAANNAPAPRWPDGKIRLGPEPGRKGYWGAPAVRTLVENAGGARANVNNDGLLANPADADRVAPFQPWAKALYLYRQKNFLKDDPYKRCLPPGGPRQFQTPNGFQFIEQRELGRILVLLGGGDRNWRIVYTDGRPPAIAAEAVLTYYGTSTARWEKDTLTVEAVGFNERFWLTNGGLPHTEALRLTERFTREGMGTLKYEVTVDDPRTYTRPWTGGWTSQWVPDREIQEYFCEENAESTFIR
jgi:hypothetical protein